MSRSITRSLLRPYRCVTHPWQHNQLRTYYYALNVNDPRNNKELFVVPQTAFRTIVINQPETKHTLTYTLLDRLYTILNAIDAHNDLAGCIVVSQDMGNRIYTTGTDTLALYNDGILAQKQLSQNVQPSNALQYNYITLCYNLLYLTSNMRKPYISMMDGLVMGSGYAIAGNGRFRLATQNTTILYNECQYGLIPHYGSIYILSRLCGKLGYWLGITGLQLNGADVFHCGYATHYVDPSAAQAIESSFTAMTPHRLTGQYAVDNVMIDYSEIPLFTYAKHMDYVDELFTNNHTMESIVQQLESTVTSGNINDINSTAYLAKRALDNIYRSSPLALKLTLSCLQLADTLSYERCLQLEYRVISELYQRNDYYSAVKNNIIEQNSTIPQWQYKSLNSVNDRIVDKIIAEHDDPRDELQLNKPDHTLHWVQGQPNHMKKDGKLYNKFDRGTADPSSVVTDNNIGVTPDDINKLFDPNQSVVYNHDMNDSDIDELARAVGIDPSVLTNAAPFKHRH